MEGEEGGLNGAVVEAAKAHFTVGFLFPDTEDLDVLLIEKKRPAWQEGKLNGLGGRVEPGETPAEAMRREAIEEAGIDPEWSEYACVEYREHVLHFFAARDTTAYNDARAQTDELLMRFPMEAWRSPRLIPNLRWLILMAHHHVFYEKVILAHILIAGSGGAIARKL